MSEPAWYVGAFEALVSPAPLALDRCLQACAILGALASASALVVAVFRLAAAAFAPMVVIQFVIGITLLLGAALSWRSPAVSRPFLIVAGVVLVAAVVLYPVFVLNVMSARSEVSRFAHAPGVLALGLAFGLRLLVDFGFDGRIIRVRIARRVGLTGLALGACLDALVMLLTTGLFTMWPRA